jgi:hypothetical protein
VTTQRALASLSAAVFAAVLAPAASAATQVGSGTTAWGEPFTLNVTEQKTPSGTLRCLEFEGPTGGGSGCPLAKPRADEIDVGSSTDCVHKQVALYGALNPAVARVQVRLVGGRIVNATRFDPNPQVDPDIAYWIATYKGLTDARSITAIAADGTVLARDRDAAQGLCEEDHPFRGRRWTVGRAVGVDHAALRLDAYRSSVQRNGRRIPGLCLGLARRLPGDAHSEATSSACGVRFERGTKALELFGAGDGCASGRMLYAYGLARRKVARIVIRSSAGETVAVPRRPPRWLHAAGRIWFATLRWPASGAVFDAQDANGKTIAKDRVKPLSPRIVGECSGDSLSGSI